MPDSPLLVTASHHQYSLEWAQFDPDAMDFTNGNGLVWVSRGRIVVKTGLDSGDLPVQFGVHDHVPPLDLDSWDEVVEVSAEIDGDRVFVYMPDGILVGEVDLPRGAGAYRLRFHARGRDAGWDAEFIDADEGDELVEQHMILIWRAVAADETVFKLTDQVGARNRSLRQ
ncbi:hypothetical protein AB0J52_15050 [Spirillospora sp. NPDC049652]